jgi:hypothetical protein
MTDTPGIEMDDDAKIIVAKEYELLLADWSDATRKMLDRMQAQHLGAPYTNVALALAIETTLAYLLATFNGAPVRLRQAHHTAERALNMSLGIRPAPGVTAFQFRDFTGRPPVTH